MIRGCGIKHNRPCGRGPVPGPAPRLPCLALPGWPPFRDVRRASRRRYEAGTRTRTAASGGLRRCEKREEKTASVVNGCSCLNRSIQCGKADQARSERWAILEMAPEAAWRLTLGPGPPVFATVRRLKAKRPGQPPNMQASGAETIMQKKTRPGKHLSLSPLSLTASSASLCLACCRRPLSVCRSWRSAEGGPRYVDGRECYHTTAPGAAGASTHQTGWDGPASCGFTAHLQLSILATEPSGTRQPVVALAGHGRWARWASSLRLPLLLPSLPSQSPIPIPGILCERPCQAVTRREGCEGGRAPGDPDPGTPMPSPQAPSLITLPSRLIACRQRRPARPSPPTLWPHDGHRGCRLPRAHDTRRDHQPTPGFGPSGWPGPPIPPSLDKSLDNPVSCCSPNWCPRDRFPTNNLPPQVVVHLFSSSGLLHNQSQLPHLLPLSCHPRLPPSLIIAAVQHQEYVVLPHARHVGTYNTVPRPAAEVVRRQTHRARTAARPGQPGWKRTGASCMRLGRSGRPMDARRGSVIKNGLAAGTAVEKESFSEPQTPVSLSPWPWASRSFELVLVPQPSPAHSLPAGGGSRCRVGNGAASEPWTTRRACTGGGSGRRKKLTKARRAIPIGNRAVWWAGATGIPTLVVASSLDSAWRRPVLTPARSGGRAPGLELQIRWEGCEKEGSPVACVTHLCPIALAH